VKISATSLLFTGELGHSEGIFILMPDINYGEEISNVSPPTSRQIFPGDYGDKAVTKQVKAQYSKLSPRNNLRFDFPPAFEKRISAIVLSCKKSLNPSNILLPLPSALKYSLKRNFGFITTVFTQFMGNEGVNNVQQSIGLVK
jgi:hypothetical protein